MNQTIVPPAPEITAAEEMEAAAISRTGALLLAARAKGRELTGPIKIDRRPIPAHRDSQAPTIRPEGNQ
jgi:hypothetical protein